MTSLQKQPPKGCSRLIWRMPIWLYHARLGWLLTSHFLLLEHTGRKSGQPRYAVLEILMHNKSNDVYYVASGFGEKSDGLQNLQKTPLAVIQVSRRRLLVDARRIQTDEAEQIILDYAHRHPAALRNLAGLLGYPLKETEAGYRLLGQILPIVALEVMGGEK